jgi:hypothetical protein
MPFQERETRMTNMKTLIAASFAVLLLGCQSPKHIVSESISYSGGDGSSCQQAVIIDDAKFRESGFLKERTWLARQYPGYRETSQSTTTLGNKHYDVIQVTTVDGQATKVYFDSTQFFAK